jgi:hypothetical protein
MLINIKSTVLVAAAIGVAGFAGIPAAQAKPVVPVAPCDPFDNVLIGDYCNIPGAQTQPLQGPGVSWNPRLGGLTAHITDRSGVASQCSYTSDFYTRSFFLPANGTHDLAIVPAVPAFRNWDVTVSCDNGTSTQASTFF